MEFTNDTQFPATLFRAGLLYKDLIMATAVIKCSFEVSDDGVVSPVPDPLALVEADLDTEFGPIDGDLTIIKEGCDFAVMGEAVAGPPGTLTDKMQVRISVEDLTRVLQVTGNRCWEKRLRGYAPSAPEPFQTMPLDYRHAFGGKAKYYDDEMGFEIDIASPLNPDGKGYVEMAAHVEGSPLPNIEEPDHLIATWQDRPDPAGCAPLPRQLPLRGLRGVHVDIEAQKTTLDPACFLFCHPKMHLHRYPAGERVSVTGMTAKGLWSALLPAIDYRLSIALGEKSYTLPLIPDTLVMLPVHNRLFVLARRAFVYQFTPERMRTAHLVQGAGAKSASATTIALARQASSPAVPIEPENPEMMPFPFDELLSYYPITGIIEAMPLLPSG